MKDGPPENQFNNNTESSDLVLIGSSTEFGPDMRKVVRTRDGPVLVVNIAGEIFAVSDVCPHSGGYLHYGPITGCVIECPLHFWPFDLRTGQLVDMPDSYDEHLSTFKVRQIGNELFLEVPHFYD